MPGVVKTKAIPVHVIALSGNGTGFMEAVKGRDEPYGDFGLKASGVTRKS